MTIEEMIVEAVSAGWTVQFAPQTTGTSEGEPGFEFRISKAETHGIIGHCNTEGIARIANGFERFKEKNMSN